MPSPRNLLIPRLQASFLSTSLVAVLLVMAPCSALASPARPLSPDRDGNAIDPQWSPDGRSIAYEVTNAQKKVTDLYLMQLSGSEEQIRPAAGASGLSGRFVERGQVNHEFAWSPTGQLYAFASSGRDDDFDLYLKTVTTPIGSEDKEGGASFSADGRMLAYCSAATGEGDLYLLDIYGLEQPPTRLTFSPGLDFYAIWSPQGARLAYAAMTESGANIHVIDDISRPKETNRALTQWKSNQIKPSWSPDGSWIAFYSNHEKKDHTSFDAYLVKVAGGRPFRVASNVVPSERRGPAWSPDGKQLVLVRNDPNLGDPLILVDIATETERVLPTGTANNGEVSLLADERTGTWRIAFVSQGKRGSEGQVWKRVWVYDLVEAARQ